MSPAASAAGAGGLPPVRPAPSSPASSRGWRLRVHESLGSTSDLILERAAAGEPEGLAVLARRQTAGRGRDGRLWESPAGNLYLSALLRPGGPASRTPQWALLGAVALAEAAAARLPDPARLVLKWPNDLLLDGGAKLAGVLVEGAAAPDGSLEWLVMGFGANLAAPPPVPDRPTACLRDAGAASVAPEVFAAELLAALDRWRDRMRRDGFAAIREAWLARGPAPGAPLRVRRPGGVDHLHGSFAGLAEDGSLLLSVEGEGLRAVSVGEITG